MAQIKVSELTALTNTDGAEEVLINDGGTSKKVTIANLLHDDSIDSKHYIDGSIDTAHIADNAITSAKLGVDVIVAEDIANNAITVAELADNAVTTAKILDDNVTAAKLANSINTDIATGVAALPKSGGTMTGDLILGDNVKLEVGSASGGDLQIYHDGSNSYIADVGTGDLTIRAGNDLRLQDSNTQAYLTGNEGGSVEIYYDNSKKLETTSSGIDVTGSVITSDKVRIVNDTSSKIELGDSGNTSIGKIEYVHSSNDLFFKVNDAERMRIDSSGRVGIGTTSPYAAANTHELTIFNSSNAWNQRAGIFLATETQGTYNSEIYYHRGTSSAADAGLKIRVHDTHAMTVKSNGNVGIGTTSPSGQLDIQAANGAGILKTTATTGTNACYGQFSNTGGGFIVGRDNSSGGILGGGAYASHLYSQGAYPLVFSTNAAERMRIESAGNVGIGLSDPQHRLHIYHSSTGAIPTDYQMGATAANENFQGIHNGNNSATFSGLALETRTNAASRWLIANEWQSDYSGDLVFRGRDGGTTSKEAMRVKSSGNVGIGTASPSFPLHVSGKIYSTGVVSSGGNSFELSDNNVTIKRATDDMTLNTGGTERMRIDSSGKVGIGVSNPYSSLDVKTTAETTGALSGHGIRLEAIGAANETVVPITASFVSSQDRARAGIGFIAGDKDSVAGYAGSIGFYTRGAADGSQLTKSDERMRITSSGRVGVNDSSPGYQFVVKSNDDSWSSWLENTTGSTPYGFKISFSNSARDNNVEKWFEGTDTGGDRIQIMADGDVRNHDNSYGAISDERIKQNITDANSQWDDIKAIKVRNYKRKDDVHQYGENAWEQIGVVAQEVELISPKLITESPPSDFELKHCGFGEQNEDGDWVVKKDSDGKDMAVKAMNYSILYMKSVKALQEAMARIETLEARITTLENA